MPDDIHSLTLSGDSALALLPHEIATSFYSAVQFDENYFLDWTPQELQHVYDQLNERILNGENIICRSEFTRNARRFPEITKLQENFITDGDLNQKDMWAWNYFRQRIDALYNQFQKICYTPDSEGNLPDSVRDVAEHITDLLQKFNLSMATWRANETQIRLPAKTIEKFRSEIIVPNGRLTEPYNRFQGFHFSVRRKLISILNSYENPVVDNDQVIS